jgi:DNA-directed RNA polymerase subunit RPC12/RpoP
MALYGKKCSNCSRDFVLSSKPHKEQTAICPGCGTEVSLADAKALPDTAETTQKEAK